MILKILNKKTKNSEPALLACKCLSNYVADDDLFKDHLDKTADEDSINNLLNVQNLHKDEPEVSHEVKNILSQLALRKPKFNGYIRDKSKLGNEIDKFKDSTNLYDETHAKDAIKDFHDDINYR